MRQILFLFWLASSLAYGLEFDVSSFEKIVENNPQAVRERLLLARYNEQIGNELKALNLIKEVLLLSPKNEAALEIKKRIEMMQKERDVFRRAGEGRSINAELLQERLKAYGQEKKYAAYTELYEALLNKNTGLKDEHHLQAASIYMQKNQYAHSLGALERLKEKEQNEAVKIRAEICYFQGDYRCAIKNYEPLYQSSYSLPYGIRLINSHIYLGELNEAERLYTFVRRSYPKNDDLDLIKAEIDSAKENYLFTRKEKYEDKPNVATLKSYVSGLYTMGKKEEGLAVLRNHNEHRQDHEALRLEAKYLTWMGQTDKALEILSAAEFDEDLRAKLLKGQIYSWNNRLDEAKKYLAEVEQKSEEDSLSFEASKALAFVMLWEDDQKGAKEAFETLSQRDPEDTEIQEALLEINKDYEALIEIYEKRLVGSQNSQKLQLRLARLYANNNQSPKAIKQLREYLKLYPDDLETTRLLGELLVQKREYHEGFGFLEYYAAQQNTAEASILLAKNYYWNGFAKEALDVLNQLLEDEPNNHTAQKLKGEILKIAPRFITGKGSSTLNSYYSDLGKKQLEIADTLYMDGHYKASLMYYESYLEQHPYAHDVRNRYALSLEHSKEHAKAEGEFALLFFQNKSPEMKYHYAYNLMNNAKQQEAEKIFNELRTQSYKALSPQLDNFLQEWKKGWESMHYNYYARFYGPSYTGDSLWRQKKQERFFKEEYISVLIRDPLYKELEDNTYHIRFYQEYKTSRSFDKGYKELWLKCDADQTLCYIDKETWEEGEYKKEMLFLPYVDNAIKEMRRKNAAPLLAVSQSGTALSSVAQPQTKTYKDIVLAPGLDKRYLKEDFVIDTVYADSSKRPLSEQLVPVRKKSGSKGKYRDSLRAEGFHFQDSGNIRFSTLDLLYTRGNIVKGLDMSVDAGLFSIEEKDVNKYKGVRYGVSLLYGNWSLRLGINNYEDFHEIVPRLNYQNSYKQHNYSLEFERQNALFYTLNLTPYEKRLRLSHFELQDNIDLGDEKSLWMSLALDAYDDKNTAFTPQFDYQFHQGTLIESELSYKLSIEGWYTAHSKLSPDYYSPDFSDATLFRIDPRYRFSQYLSLHMRAGIGHSFYNKAMQYKYGGWLEGGVRDELNYTLGCQSSNSARGSTGGDYDFMECKAQLEYSW